jgi:hypothetical protein
MKKTMFKIFLVLLAALVLTAAEDKKPFTGLPLGLGELSRLSHAQTRSISPENFTGEKGKAAMSTNGPAMKAARDLGQGWKISPFVVIKPKETFVLADVQGMGAIQQIWMTPSGTWRYAILRFYWDGEKEPSVETPIGDFFACGWQRYAQISSLPVCVNPGSAFNSYWNMPFRKSFRITIENLADENFTIYYQINYTLTDVPEDAAYFHAQFRRVNPLSYKDVCTILDGVKGWGHYVGTYLAWGVNNNGWWGEGEIKFYLDGDREFPTICGTGTEDYFCGAFDFDPGIVERDRPGGSAYVEFTTPFAGLPQVIRPDGAYKSQTRFGMYRFHVMDPVRFESDLRITIQALGWRTHKDRQYLPLQDDIASVAYWYQTLPTAPFPALPDRDYLEVV